MLTIEQIAHREYLKSATWKDIRLQVLQRDNHTCQRCGQSGYDVHHKTYQNWGNEQLNDLITLCRSCHEQWHQVQKGTRRSKAIGTRAIWNYLTKYQKEQLCKEFHLNELNLYFNIYLKPNNSICIRAAKILGYDHWYIQQENNKTNLIQSDRIKRRKQRKYQRYKKLQKIK